MSADDPNKIYYDVNIRYDPQNLDRSLHFFSPAKTTIRMNSPLITDTDSYDLCISKFKIDTECVPIFIPEMEQPVTEKEYDDINTTPYLYSNYKIAVINNAGHGEIARIKIFRNRRATHSSQEKTPYFKFFKKGGQTYVDNTDESLFMYDYQTFINYVNVALQTAVSAVNSKTTKQNKLEQEAGACFFKIVGDKLRFYFTSEFSENRWSIAFSGNLYRLIGNGFPLGHCIDMKVTESEDKLKGFYFIETYAERDLDVTEVFNFVGGIYESLNTHLPERRSYFGTVFVSGQEIISGRDPDDPDTQKDVKYYYHDQQFSTFPNWNICNAILICSGDLPINGEYYPVFQTRDGFLTHYNEPWYMRVSEGTKLRTEEDNIFNKNTTKIIDVYYPLSTTGGDIQSSIIYDNTDIENGNKIDMFKGVALDHFDIYLKWVDIYGNMYDLMLAPGRSVNLRLCFTRKKIKREDLAYCTQVLLAALQPEKDPVQYSVENDPFVLREEPPNKKRNMVIEEGYAPCGLQIK